MQWYYVVGDERKGPFDDEQFEGLVKSGEIQPSSLVWNDTFEDWLPYEQFVQSAATSDQDGAFFQCCECEQNFGKDDVLEYQGVYVCGNCKDAFFQRVNEGARFISSKGGLGESSAGEIMRFAREALRGKWGISIGFCILLGIVSLIPNFISQVIAIPIALLPGKTSMFVLPILMCAVSILFLPLQIGTPKFFIAVCRDDSLNIVDMFFGYRIFRKSIGAQLMMGLLIFLWGLLFIIPGIVVGLSYAMVPYVLADNPEIGIMDALRRSKKIMRGNRMKFLGISLLLGLLMLLSLLTLYIGLIWAVPYMSATCASFYEDVRGIE